MNPQNFKFTITHGNTNRWRSRSEGILLNVLRVFASCITLALLTTMASAQVPVQQHPIASEPLSRSAEDDATADRLFNQGNSLTRDKKGEEALAAYLGAWKARRTFEIAVNLGLLEIDLNKPRDAAEHLNLALLNVPKEAPDALRTELQHALDDAKTKIGTVTIATSEGGELLIDGESSQGLKAGTATDLFFLPGSRRLTLHLDGYEDASQTIEITQGSAQRISLSLTKRPPPPEIVDTPLRPVRHLPASPPSPARKRSMVPVVIGGVLVAAGLAIGIGETFAANAKSSDAYSQRATILAQATPQLAASSSECYQPVGAMVDQCTALANTWKASDRAHNIAVGGFIGGGAALVLTTAYLVFWPAPKRPGVRATLRLIPGTLEGRPGASLIGEF
jgi:hypothetical protein